jgi:DNA uptake protein ComE-like DNA-binding protein
VSDRRSFILLAVLVVMVSAILVATSLLFVAQTEAAGAAGAEDAAQARALLWSGTQAILAELHDQRESILAGDMPGLQPQYVIYETSTRAGVVRVLPIGPGGAVLIPEAGKLDINQVDAAALARTGMVDAAVAESIVSWRSRLGRPIQSTAELLEAPGVTAETLYGSVDALLAGEHVIASLSERGPSADEALVAPARSLADVVTVFSFEPAVQRTGKLRINLNVPWSEELARRVEERFGLDAVTVLKQIFESGTKFDSDMAIFAALRRFQTSLEQWPDIIDTFTAESGEIHFSRLDINTAPREALLGLPGVMPEQAAQIASVRQELSDDQRATIAWPAMRQILKPEQYEALAGRITTRCWTWRVRIAAGEVDADAPAGPIGNPQVQELVIDMCGPRPRVAYLRDVTLLGNTALMAREASRGGTADTSWPKVQDDGAAGRNPASAAQIAPEATSRPARNPRGAATSRGPMRPSTTRPRESPRPNADADADADAQSAPQQPPARQRIGRWTAG